MLENVKVKIVNNEVVGEFPEEDKALGYLLNELECRHEDMFNAFENVLLGSKDEDETQSEAAFADVGAEVTLVGILLDFLPGEDVTYKTKELYQFMKRYYRAIESNQNRTTIDKLVKSERILEKYIQKEKHSFIPEMNSIFDQLNEFYVHPIEKYFFFSDTDEKSTEQVTYLVDSKKKVRIAKGWRTKDYHMNHELQKRHRQLLKSLELMAENFCSGKGNNVTAVFDIEAQDVRIYALKDKWFPSHTDKKYESWKKRFLDEYEEVDDIC